MTTKKTETKPEETKVEAAQSEPVSVQKAFRPAAAYRYTGTAEGMMPNVGAVKPGAVIEPMDADHALRMVESGVFEPQKKGREE